MALSGFLRSLFILTFCIFVVFNGFVLSQESSTNTTKAPVKCTEGDAAVKTIKSLNLPLPVDMMAKVPGMTTCLASTGMDIFSMLSKECKLGDLLLIKQLDLVKIVSPKMGVIMSSVQSGDYSSAISAVLNITHSIQSSHMDGMCTMFSSTLSPCLSKFLPKLLEHIQEKSCCTDLNNVLNIASVALVPSESKRGLEGFFGTVLYDIEALLCTRKTQADDSTKSETCGYNLLRGLFPKVNLSKTLSNLIEVLTGLFQTPREEQCAVLNGKEIILKSGDKRAFWKFEGCSVQWDNLMRYVQRIPIVQLFMNEKIPLLEVPVSSILAGFPEAPCCVFSSEIEVPKDLYKADKIEINCKDKSQPINTNATTATCPKSSPIMNVLPGMFQKLPGLSTCLSDSKGPSVYNLFKSMGECPSCKFSLLTSLLSSSFISKIKVIIPAIKNSQIIDIVSGIQSLNNADFAQLCGILDKKLLPCLSQWMPKVVKLMDSECCSSWNSMLVKVYPVVLPSDLLKDYNEKHASHISSSPLLSLIERFLTRVDRLLCSKRAKDSPKDTCGFHFVNALFNNGFTSLIDRIPKMFGIPEKNQCVLLNGEEVDGKVLWNVGECSVQWEGLFATLRSIPLVQLLKTFKIDILQITGKDILDGWKQAPCCKFDTEVEIPENKFKIQLPKPLCKGGSSSNNDDKCSSSHLAMPFNLIPGASTCINTPNGISLSSILKDMSNHETCSISMFQKILGNPVITKLIGEISGGLEPLKLYTYLSSLKNEEYTSLCEIVNKNLMPCLANLIPDIFKRLESKCCQSFNNVLQVLSLLVVPEGVNGGLEGFVSTLLGDIQLAACSVQTNKERNVCIFSFIKNLFLAAKPIPKDVQCDAFNNKKVTINGSQVNFWDFGECSAHMSTLLRRIGHIPLLRALQKFKVMDFLEVGKFLNGWVETPCCDFETKTEELKVLFDVKRPLPECRVKPDTKTCKESTVIPFILYLKNMADVGECMGSGWNFGFMFDEFGKSKKCSKFLVDDILSGKDPSVNSIKTVLGDVMKGMKSDPVGGLLLGVDHLLKLMRTKFSNNGMKLFCTFMTESMGECLSEWIDNIFDKLDNEKCCDNFKKFVNEFYENNFQPKKMKDVYGDLRTFVKGILNNLTGTLCMKQSNDICGYKLLKSTMGFDYTKNSKDLDPLSALGIFTVYPLFQMLTLPKGQACNMLTGKEFVLNSSQQCKRWNGMWYKYGCCGHPLGSLLQTFGEIPILKGSEKKISLKNLGLQHFLVPEISLKQILTGYPDIGCCKEELGQCSYPNEKDSVYKVDLPKMPTCEKFESKCTQE